MRPTGIFRRLISDAEGPILNFALITLVERYLRPHVIYSIKGKLTSFLTSLFLCRRLTHRVISQSSVKILKRGNETKIFDSSLSQ